jgi:hypothetical protein
MRNRRPGYVSGNGVLANGRLCGSTREDQNGQEVNKFNQQTRTFVSGDLCV